MIARTIAPLLALALLLPAAATLAAPPRPEYQLEVECHKSKVDLGEEIPLEIRLEKKRGKSIQAAEMRLARNSVSIRVEAGGKTYTITRIHGFEAMGHDGKTWLMKDDDPPRTTLKRGRALKLALPVLAIVPGKLEITAVYAGFPEGIDPVESEPVEVTVKAPKGKKAIAAEMTTSEGTMVIGFWPDKAFNTVWNFLTLAKAGRYDGLVFHRIVKGFMIQGGDPEGNGTGDPGWNIPAEFNDDLKHVPGVISMARRRAPGSGGCQFFIMDGEKPHLDGKYAAFGKVVEGMDVVRKIADLPVGPNAGGERSKPVKPPVIESVKVTTR